MYPFVKRFLDIVFSGLGLICLSPVLLILGGLVKATSPGPVFFAQKRIGLGKTTFTMLKFRTMRIDAPADTPTHLLRNPLAYITKIGAFLRKTSLDELPQLWNILKGDMSLIGPRPALWNQDDLVAWRDHYGANGLRPGLTGLAQIRGRDELPIEVKAAYDGEYCRNLSFGQDCRILWRTVFAVLTGKDVSA
ncbi:MAG: sugar transferase [Clostridiales bacterium]|nr:sugar transferase [Clostridiales bacterium]